jgi:hypothetical protein
VIGTFSVRIPVATAESLLLPEENTLAIMRWRLAQRSPTDRWRPVLERYVDDLAGRVIGLGGNPDTIPPSPDGVPVRAKDPCGDLVEHAGRVEQVGFDCHGRIEGFVLAGCCDRHEYVTRDPGLAELILRACRERLDLAVLSPRHQPEDVVRVIVRS